MTVLSTNNPWCVVIADQADDHLLGRSLRDGAPPIQYCSLDSSAPLLHRALQRATAIAPSVQVLMTALAQHREHWRAAAWFVRPAQRFICDGRAALQLSSVAALLSIAAHSPSAVVVVIPARCYVAHEWILRNAFHRALAELPETAEGVITFGMRDIEDSDDEDYLVVSRTAAHRGLKIDAVARRPVPWVSAHLKREGALVASGILIGYAAAFASYIFRTLPGVARELSDLSASAKAAGTECTVSSDMILGVPSLQRQTLRWMPPALPQRALAVSRSGWSGLRSARALARLTDFYSPRAPLRHQGTIARLQPAH